MRITVKLFATFRKGRFDTEVREVPPGTTVSSVIDGMQLPGSVGIIFVNSQHADPKRELEDGDTSPSSPSSGEGQRAMSPEVFFDNRYIDNDISNCAGGIPRQAHWREPLLFVSGEGVTH